MDGGGRERIGRANDGAYVGVVREVLDRHVQRVPSGVDVGDDRVARPISVGVDDVAPVTVFEQFGVVLRIGGRGCPELVGPRPHTVRMFAPFCRSGDRERVLLVVRPGFSVRHDQNVSFESEATENPCPVLSLVQVTSVSVVAHV